MIQNLISLSKNTFRKSLTPLSKDATYFSVPSKDSLVQAHFECHSTSISLGQAVKKSSNVLYEKESIQLFWVLGWSDEVSELSEQSDFGLLSLRKRQKFPLLAYFTLSLCFAVKLNMSGRTEQFILL